jgi:hypothetical protein
MAQLRAEGRCFLCKDVGHLSRNCPRRNTMSGNGNNKPPGVPSYSMTMSLIEDENDSGDVLRSMPVGSIYILDAEMLVDVPEPVVVPSETWREDYPFWQNANALARDRIGNCYEMTAESLLTRFQPYPGDELLRETAHECAPFNRFNVKQSHSNSLNFRIHDLYNDFKITIPKSRLENPRFNLAHWYAKERARAQNTEKPDKRKYPPQIENPIALVTFHLLRNGVSSHFPNTSPDSWTDDRFFVFLKDYDSTTYIIIDDDLDIRTEIDLSNLENPNFDLINWYKAHVEMEGAFCDKYIIKHEGAYCQTPQTAPVTMHARVKPSSMREEVTLLKNVVETLERCSPYPGDDLPQHPVDPTYRPEQKRFEMDLIDAVDQQLVYVYDRVQGCENFLTGDLACWDQFSIGKWYAEHCAVNCKDKYPWDTAHEWMMDHEWEFTTIAGGTQSRDRSDVEDTSDDHNGDGDSSDDEDDDPDKPSDDHKMLALNGVQVDRKF